MTVNKKYKKKIVLARNSFPYKGGSSTILYMLFESLQKYLPNIEFWNLITSSDKEIGARYYGKFWFNPKGLPNVKAFLIDEKKRTLRTYIKKTKPDIILSKSRISTGLLKQLYPAAQLWHLTSTCGAIKNAISAGNCQSMQDAIRQLRENKFTRSYNSEEHTAIKYADRILFHTHTMQLWYFNLYPEFTEKMERRIFWDYTILKRHIKHKDISGNSWEKRPIDLLFVASDWKRPEKNFPLLRELCRQFSDRRIVVIGFVPTSLPEGVISYNTMTHFDVIQTMANAKVIVSPSRYDEAPNILFEGALTGCNIVCSRNCGNYGLAPPELLAELKVSDFVSKIKKALRRKYANKEELFSKDDLQKWMLGEISR